MRGLISRSPATDHPATVVHRLLACLTACYHPAPQHAPSACKAKTSARAAKDRERQRHSRQEKRRQNAAAKAPPAVHRPDVEDDAPGRGSDCHPFTHDAVIRHLTSIPEISSTPEISSIPKISSIPELSLIPERILPTTYEAYYVKGRNHEYCGPLLNGYIGFDS